MGVVKGYQPDMVIRSFTKHDYEACAQIYEEGMATGIATFETHVPNWEQWDAKFLKTCRLVAQDEETVVGWCALTPFSNREVYRGVAEVTLYIASQYRGEGIGKQLLQALIDESEAVGFWTLQAKIFTTNTASIQLHKNCGFRIVGVRKKLGKRDGIWHDNMLLERRNHIQ